MQPSRPDSIMKGDIPPKLYVFLSCTNNSTKFNLHPLAYLQCKLHCSQYFCKGMKDSSNALEVTIFTAKICLHLSCIFCNFTIFRTLPIRCYMYGSLMGLPTNYWHFLASYMSSLRVFARKSYNLYSIWIQPQDQIVRQSILPNINQLNLQITILMDLSPLILNRVNVPFVMLVFCIYEG